jgi:GTP 3',8-cyclase
MSPVRDRNTRPLRDLRISVTDRCNFRCTYCMPKEIFGRNFVFFGREQLLSFEEITRVTRVFAREGVSKVRLTGGEPLLRRDLEQLVAMLADIDGIVDIALTTNGSALAATGLAPIKINMVVKRGANDSCTIEMADHFRSSGHILRFINTWTSALVCV